MPFAKFIVKGFDQGSRGDVGIEGARVVYHAHPVILERI
jgi:hypothetical protein